MKGNFNETVKTLQAVIPAQAGIHNIFKSLDSRLRGTKMAKIDLTRGKPA